MTEPKMRTDRFVYITGPITARNGHSVESNVATALSLYLACLNEGIPAFCPQLSAIFPSAHTDVEYEIWHAYDFAVIDRCTHVLTLPRWRESPGALREVEYALSKYIPVVHSLQDLL
jgi:uncharacterized protein DUF4406